MKYQNVLAMTMVVLIIFSASSHAQNMSQPYRNSKYGFTISFPRGWQIKGSSQKNTLVKAVHKDIHNRIALIAIAAYEIGMDGDIWEATGEDMFDGFKTDYPNADATLLDSGKAVINGKHAIWTKIVVKNVWFGLMTSLNYHLIHNKVLFRISGSADTDAKWFDENESVFRESISSIVFDTYYYKNSEGVITKEGDRNSRIGVTNFDKGYKSPKSVIIEYEQESWLITFLKAYGRVILTVMAITAIIGIAKYILAKLKVKKNQQNE